MYPTLKDKATFVLFSAYRSPTRDISLVSAWLPLWPWNGKGGLILVS